MDLDSKNIQLQYQGFINTPCLWVEDLHGLKQMQFIEPNIGVFNDLIPSNLRLGKRVEHFVFHHLQQNSAIKILAENIQIQKGKITVGELDCLLLKDQTPIHLEIVYKFYLYDSSVGTTELEHWIGPNRKDALIQKLEKLKNKQLPLLHTSDCKTYLEQLDLNASEIEQNVYFKAQLFVPFKERNHAFNLINQECIIGFYINLTELKEFTTCKFYIPEKKNWLVITHTNVSWLTFDVFLTKVADYMEREFSPLCWIKNQNGEIDKAFLIWWK